MVIWKTYLSCAISVFTLAVVGQAMDGSDVVDVSGAVLKFGTQNVTSNTFEVLPGSLIVGAISGLLGALFVVISSNMGVLRKKYITQNW